MSYLGNPYIFGANYNGDSTKTFSVANATSKQNATPIGQIQSQSGTAFTTGGTAPAYTLTPTPAITGYATYQRFNVTFVGTGTTGSNTINISGFGTIPLNQFASDGTLAAAIVTNGMNSDVQIVSNGTYALLLDPLPTNSTASVRNTVQSGALSSGQAACISVGSGLQPTLLATSTPLSMTFASGFGGGGQIDLPCYLSADQSYPAVPASNTSFLYATRISAGNVTLGSTLAIPQYGYSYNQTAQALLHFDGTNGATTTTDDFGNTVTLAGSAHLDTSVSKFGTSSLSLNGTTDYAKIPAIVAVPNGSWAIRGWFDFTSVTGIQTFFCLLNVSGFGITLEMTSAKTNLSLSSTGSSWDIATNTVGTVTFVVGTQYFIELTFDAVAGKYFVYVNGVVDQTISSSSKASYAPSGLLIGSYNTTPSSLFAGHVDEFEFLSYCDHPTGTSYSVPTGAKSVATVGYASDWYSIAEGKMYSITGPSVTSGINPTMTQVIRNYVGECTAGTSSISSVTSYAYNRKSDSGLFLVAGSTAYTKIHNVGISPSTYKVFVTMADDILGTNERPVVNYSTTTGNFGGTTTRNSFTIDTLVNVGLSTTGANLTSAYYRIRVEGAI